MTLLVLTPFYSIESIVLINEYFELKYTINLDF